MALAGEIKSFLHSKINQKLFSDLFAQRIKSYNGRAESIYMTCEILHQLVSNWLD